MTSGEDVILSIVGFMAIVVVIGVGNATNSNTEQGLEYLLVILALLAVESKIGLIRGLLGLISDFLTGSDND
jgi:hypothetical protein